MRKVSVLGAGHSLRLCPFFHAENGLLCCEVLVLFLVLFK